MRLSEKLKEKVELLTRVVVNGDDIARLALESGWSLTSLDKIFEIMDIFSQKNPSTYTYADVEQTFRDTLNFGYRDLRRILIAFGKDGLYLDVIANYLKTNPQDIQSYLAESPKGKGEFEKELEEKSLKRELEKLTEELDKELDKLFGKLKFMEEEEAKELEELEELRRKVSLLTSENHLARLALVRGWGIGIFCTIPETMRVFWQKNPSTYTCADMEEAFKDTLNLDYQDLRQILIAFGKDGLYLDVIANYLKTNPQDIQSYLSEFFKDED